MKYLKVYEDYIFEGKKEFLQGKYKLEPDLFNKLIDADPTNGKYFEWIITRYIKSKDKKVYLEDLYKIKEYLTTFDVLKKQYKIKETDIGKYLDYKDLFLKISEIGGTGNVSEDETYLTNDRLFINNGEADLFYEADNYLIVIPRTLKAAQFYSNNTQWCTQYPDNYADYTSKGDLYIIINKKLLNTTDSNRRLQFHFETNSFMDITDNNLKVNIKSDFLDIFKDNELVWLLEMVITEYTTFYIVIRINWKYGIYMLRYDEDLEEYVFYDGEIVVMCVYDDIKLIYEDFLVKYNGKYGVLSSKRMCDEMLIDAEYDKISEYRNAYKAELNGEITYFDQDGIEYSDWNYGIKK